MPRTISVSGADISLFHLAARELGDARQAWRIAAANGVSEFFLYGLGVLVIPDPDPTATTGLPQL